MLHLVILIIILSHEEKSTKDTGHLVADRVPPCFQVAWAESCIILAFSDLK